jgi:AraC family transcriptional regulator
MAIKLPPGNFFGQTQRRIQVSGLTFAETVYESGPELSIPVHAHEHAFFHFLIDGVCEEMYGRTVRTSGPSALAFHPAGEPHSNRWRSPGGRVFHIDISGTRAEAIREHAPFLDRPTEVLGGMGPWLAKRLYQEYRRLDNVSPLAMEGLTLEILAEASRDGAHALDRRPPRWLLQARELLHDRFSENLSLGEVAKAVGIHPVHLARAFRKQYGCTLGDYIRRLRVEFACRKLSASETPLAQIAILCGFSDQSHFTNSFRRQMRMTPGEFRRIFRPR